jgi:putative ABC transport system ATP-binding protein
MDDRQSSTVSTADQYGGEEASPGTGPAIEARDLFKIYKQGPVETVALRGASLEVGEGEFVSLQGPSGSGKSTLLSVLTGLAAPSAGEVVVDGRSLSGLDEPDLARWRAERVGMVFQRGNLLPFLTAEENVALIARRGRPRREARERAKELLGLLGLADRVGHRPSRLSGGEVQRVGIAVALANEPAYLFGDEITGELDTATSESVMEALLAIRRERGITMVLVTHNQAIAALADRRLVVSGGVVTAP